jgi:hypothetical protein
MRVAGSGAEQFAVVCSHEVQHGSYPFRNETENCLGRVELKTIEALPVVVLFPLSKARAGLMLTARTQIFFALGDMFQNGGHPH